LKEVIAPDRVGNYEDAKFESVFKKFDEDKNGYLEKAEMAVLIKKVFAAPKWVPSNKIEFRYFALFGRGSPGRAMLSHAKVDFTDICEDLGNWGKVKAGPPYNGKSLPILVYPDGRILRQSKAIYRHIAKEHGFYPGDPELAFPNDWIVDTYYDHYNDNGLTNFNATEEWVKTTFETKIPSLMNKLKPYLENEHKFLLDSEPLLCDFVVGTFYTDLVTNPQAYGREEFAKLLEEYPKFKEFGEAYKAALGSYVDGREPRPM
jgi:glutathione S-transferase